MTKWLLKAATAAVVVLALAYPITRELSARSAIQHGLINNLDANDRAALKAWPGSAESFIDMLHDRCMRAHSGDAETCKQYRSAAN
jgi:hypothetical protein